MPELPEVETIRLQLHPHLRGQHIVDVGTHPSHRFSSALRSLNHTICDIKRKGKYLIVPLASRRTAHDTAQQHDTARHTHDTARHITSRTIHDTARHITSRTTHNISRPSSELIIHLGMTGRLAVSHQPDMAHPHLRAWWLLKNGRTFTFHDVRRFGRVYMVQPGNYSAIHTLNHLGPEPFSSEFTGTSLWQVLRTSRRQLKTQLLSQRPVAGIGNIYADEALWLARIKPTIRQLSLERSNRLASAIKDTLASGLRNQGTTLRDYVTVEGRLGENQYHLECYGRHGNACSRCGELLLRLVVDARGTTWCPKCQSR